MKEYPAGIVAFGADDEKAARLADLVRLAGNLLTVLFQRLCKHVARVEEMCIRDSVRTLPKNAP